MVYYFFHIFTGWLAVSWWILLQNFHRFPYTSPFSWQVNRVKTWEMASSFQAPTCMASHLWVAWLGLPYTEENDCKKEKQNLLRCGLISPRTSFPPYPIGKIKSQGQLIFKRSENRIHLFLVVRNCTHQNTVYKIICTNITYEFWVPWVESSPHMNPQETKHPRWKTPIY